MRLEHIAASTLRCWENGGAADEKPGGEFTDRARSQSARPVRLGLRENVAQFSLLVGVNALVGGSTAEGASSPLRLRAIGRHDRSQR